MSDELFFKLLGRFTSGQLLLLAWLFRALLILYGEWQDRALAVKFTDIDYLVFTDAANHVVRGASPYLRPTYRYTPLLSWLLVPNHLLFLAFGKLIFISVDVLAGWVMYRILSLQRLSERTKMAACVLWLFNPLTATVSSRGNAESLVALLVLLTVYLLMAGHVTMAAIFYGLSVHFKIYPVIYSLALLLSIAHLGDGIRGCSGHLSSVRWILRRFLSPTCIKFVVTSFSTFAVITGLCYNM